MNNKSITWRDALAKMGIAPKKIETPQMVFEIDGANGEKLTFPDANDITEVKEESAITAEDGEHVFIADGKTYTIEVLAGVVTKLTIDEPVAEDTTMAEILQAFANEFELNTVEKTEMKATILRLENTVSEMKTLMVHGKDEPKKDFSFGGKKIDFNKLNNK